MPSLLPSPRINFSHLEIMEAGSLSLVAILIEIMHCEALLAAIGVQHRQLNRPRS
jgi:hypothetical protein